MNRHERRRAKVLEKTTLSPEHSPAVAEIGHNGPPSAIDDPDHWYGLIDTKAMAEFLNVTDRALQKWRRTGDGPKFVRISASCVRYRRIDGRAWSEALLRSSTSDPGPEADAA